METSVIILQEGKYDVYMEVAKCLNWINLTISRNGGMASCNRFMITAKPILGNIAINRYINTSILPGELRPEKPQFGVLVTGGKDSSFNHLSSAEFLGPKKCQIPPLPKASFT